MGNVGLKKLLLEHTNTVKNLIIFDVFMLIGKDLFWLLGR